MGNISQWMVIFKGRGRIRINFDPFCYSDKTHIQNERSSSSDHFDTKLEWIMNSSFTTHEMGSSPIILVRSFRRKSVEFKCFQNLF